MFKMIVESALPVPNRRMIVLFGTCENRRDLTRFLRDEHGRMISVIQPMIKRLDFSEEVMERRIMLGTNDLSDAESIIGVELFGVPREEWPER